MPSWLGEPIQWFLDLITPATEFSVEFFESIGQAVAGYLGGFFEPIFHSLLDFFISLIYFGQYVFAILASLFAPVLYVFNFLKGLVYEVTSPVVYNNSIEFSANVLALYDSVPMFSDLMIVLGGILILMSVIALIKIFAK